MLEKIEKLISEKEYSDALEIIKSELEKRDFDYSKEEDSKLHSELLSLRITVNNRMNKIDDAVLHLSRKELIPYVMKIELQPNKFVHLIDKNVFRFKCDAFVNTIHKEKLFNYSERSFSHILQKSIGKEEIERQIDTSGDFQKKGFLILNHSNLMAPISYHLPVIYGSHKIDIEKLHFGIKQVLADVTSKGLKTIGFAALGMGGTPTNPERKMDDFSIEEEEIVNIIVKSVSEYFQGQKNKLTPEIYFAFISFRSFHLFDKIFRNYTPKGKILLKFDKTISDTQEKLINKVGTKNKKYISILKDLVYGINDEESILLLGETGVGKTFLAKEYHKLSPRFNGSNDNLNFNSLNCASLTRKSMYAEIFGFVKGSFTSADHEGKSLFEVVENGTVFLDEIGYSDLGTQKALLTLVESKEYKKYGDQILRKANVRMIFGTNQDLESLIHQHLFAHDFYARIANEFMFIIPPLRERPEDIEELVTMQIEDLKEKKGSLIFIEKDALDLLVHYPWYENVRQLLSYVRKLFIEASKLKSKIITKTFIQDNPPREFQLLPDNNLALFESMIRIYLSTWDSSKHGKFRDDFIEPIISKVFLEDLKSKKSKSNSILGIDGDRKDSPLDEAIEKYKKVLKNFK